MFYHEALARITDLAASLPPDALLVEVPTCPGWTVHDVVSHLLGVVEDALAGRLKNPPPSEAQTAEQVARYRDMPMDEMLGRWAAGAPQFEHFIGSYDIWPAAVDVVSHEQDIRGALGLPRARDVAGVRELSTKLLENYRPPVPYTVEVEDTAFKCGDDDIASDLTLRSTYWDVMRWRMGRRSRAQLAGMAWSNNPAPVLDHMHVFGPSKVDIFE